MILPGPTVVILKGFEAPDEVREFRRGRFELVTIGGMTIGRATYQRGWKWSVDVGPAVGDTGCRLEHLGLVLHGRARQSRAVSAGRERGADGCVGKRPERGWPFKSKGEAAARNGW